MVIIHIIGEKDFALLVDLEERQNLDNQDSEIGTELLMETRVFTSNLSSSRLILTILIF